MPKVSVVMTTFNRPHLLLGTLNSLRAQSFKDYEIVVVDDGTDNETEKICSDFEARHIKLVRPASATYRNPARPNNVGVRRATGDVVILQNAECRHIDPDTIEKLSSLVTDTNVSFARVLALHEDGRIDYAYCGQDNQRPYFFCGAIKRSWFEKLRGFDEDFVGYGYDDDDFADRLTKEGVTFQYTDIEVHHQWHPSGGSPDAVNAALYGHKRLHDGNIRNLNREWGTV